MLRRKVLDKLSRLGLKDGGLLLLTRLFQITTGGRLRLVRYYFIAQPVPDPDKRPALRDTPGNPTELIGREAIVVGSFPRPDEVIQARFDAGYICVVTRIGGEFAGYLWLARKAYEEDEVRCRYELTEPEISAWDFDVYVKPEHRVSRAFVRLWAAANDHLHGVGVQWTFSRISAFSKRSLNSHARMGTQVLSSATFLCAGPLQLSFLGCAPYLHVSLSARSRPKIAFAPPAQAIDAITA